MTYCISDIHGCFPEFITMIRQIKFNSDKDVLYILGDVVDRGKQSIPMLQYIKRHPAMCLIKGNHEIKMLELLSTDYDQALRSEQSTLRQFKELSPERQINLFSWLMDLPLYKIITVNKQLFFLSHAGLDVKKPLNKQTVTDFTWNRQFARSEGLKGHICIFGHTPTLLYRNRRISDHSVWFDDKYFNKINIDSGCVFGGALSCIRLDDGALFYVKSKNFKGMLNNINTAPAPYFK